MNENKISWMIVLAYFFFSTLAAGPLAVYIAETIVEARQVSNFEGASGYAVVFAVPFYFLLSAICFWLAYLLFRRSTAILYLATFSFAILSIPTFQFLAELL